MTCDIEINTMAIVTTKTAASRKNGNFGYKALVRRADGSTHIPVRKNFATADEARAYAQKWIDANDAHRRHRGGGS